MGTGARGRTIATALSLWLFCSWSRWTSVLFSVLLPEFRQFRLHSNVVLCTTIDHSRQYPVTSQRNVFQWHLPVWMGKFGIAPLHTPCLLICYFFLPVKSWPRDVAEFMFLQFKLRVCCTPVAGGLVAALDQCACKVSPAVSQEDRTGTKRGEPLQKQWLRIRHAISGPSQRLKSTPVAPSFGTSNVSRVCVGSPYSSGTRFFGKSTRAPKPIAAASICPASISDSPSGFKS